MRSMACFSLALPTLARCERPSGGVLEGLEGPAGALGAGAGRKMRIRRPHAGRRVSSSLSPSLQMGAPRWGGVSRRRALSEAGRPVKGKVARPAPTQRANGAWRRPPGARRSASVSTCGRAAGLVVDRLGRGTSAGRSGCRADADVPDLPSSAVAAAGADRWRRAGHRRGSGSGSRARSVRFGVDGDSRRRP